MVRKYTRKVRQNRRHTRRRGGGILNKVKGFLKRVPSQPPSSMTTHQRSPRSSNTPSGETIVVNPIFKAQAKENAAIGIVNNTARPEPPSRESSINLPGEVPVDLNFRNTAKKLAELPNSRRTSNASTFTFSRRNSNADNMSRRGSTISNASNITRRGSTLSNSGSINSEQAYKTHMGYNSNIRKNKPLTPSKKRILESIGAY